MRKQSVYIGNCSNNGLYKYSFFNGKLIHNMDTLDYEKCTFLTKYKDMIYGVLELSGEITGYVVSYKVEKNKIVNMDRKVCYGQGPCHISLSKKNKLIFVSNYTDGYFTVFKMLSDGHIGDKVFSSVLEKGISHMHYSQMIDEHLLCAVDLGANSIVVYNVGEKIEEITRLYLGENIQPRHFVVVNNFIYVVTESTCRIYTIVFQNRQLKVLKYQDILPINVEKKDNYTGCAIKLSKDNKYIYISIRGHNSISVFKNENNTLKLIQNINCKGNVPRDIELDKYNKYMFVANTDSNDVGIFKRNTHTGKLRYYSSVEVKSPTCIIAE